MTVEDAFGIPGRGTAVLGQFEGTARRGDRAVIIVGDSRAAVDRVGFEMLDRIGPHGERAGLPVLLLYGQAIDAVPIGAVVGSED